MRAAIATKQLAPSLAEQIIAAKATVARLHKLEAETVAQAQAAFAGGAGFVETPKETTVRHAAELLLQGDDVLHSLDPPRNRSLVLEERLAAIREALRIALKRLWHLMLSREAEVQQEFMPFWLEHVGKVVAMIDGLRELAAQRRALIERWTERTGFRPQPIGSAEADEMLGLIDPFDRDHVHGDSACGRLLDAAKRAGVR
jgi:hypothetical protein